jgi:dienelactone hydrolase
MVTSPPVTSSTTTTAVLTTTVPPTTERPRATGVGTVMLDVVDATRPTVQNGRRLSSTRHLPTIVRYPAVGPVGATELSGARPAPGAWPLVVFAHGYNVTPGTYAHLLHAWAAAGFVVAAPSFPLETAGGPLDENDLSNEPADIRVVIDTVLAQNSAPSGTLAHLIDARHIAVAGHSDGAEAALAVGFVNGGDPRIGPVISMAAQGIIGGPRPDPRHPLLVVQGDHDTINPPARGDAVYRAGGAPKYELRLLGAGHLPPVADDTAWRPIVEQVGIDFLRRSFGGAVTVGILEADATKPGLSTLTADP